MWTNKSRPARLKGGQSACKPLHISPRVHLSKWPPVPPSASLVSSHGCSSWQRIWKGRVIGGVDFPYYSPGSDGEGARREKGGCEPISRNTVSCHLCALQNKCPNQTAQDLISEHSGSRTETFQAINLRDPPWSDHTEALIIGVKCPQANLICNHLYHLPRFRQQKRQIPPCLSWQCSSRDRPVSARQKSRHVKARRHKWGSDITDLFVGKL